MSSSQTPIYELYGEFISDTQFDPVHYETIKERSVKHGWTIKQHRHKTLAQVFYFKTAGVRVRSNDTDYLTSNPTILFIPPMVRHGFLFPKGIVGDVISIPLDELTDTGRRTLGELSSLEATVISEPGGGPTDQNWSLAQTTIGQIGFAFGELSEERNELLRNLTNVLLLSIRRISRRSQMLGHTKTNLDMTAHESKTQENRNLVETSFSKVVPIDQYAAELGISAPHLNRICKKILKCSPNTVITSRRMIEAKRLLEFTRHTIADIAHRAGYREVAYFNRAFKKHTGITPGAFRKMRRH